MSVFVNQRRKIVTQEIGEMGPLEAYKNTLALSQQAVVCREYLEYASGWSLYADWRQETGRQDTSLSVVEYVESLPSFFDWLEM